MTVQFVRTCRHDGHGPEPQTVLDSEVQEGDNGDVTTNRELRRSTESSNGRGTQRRRTSVLVALGAVALGLAACGGSSSSTSTTNPPQTTTTTTGSSTSSTSAASTSTTAASLTACRTASLSVSLGGPNGSAGSTHYGLTFHNSGSAACTLYGYPGVSFLDAAGHQIGAPAQRQTGITSATVTLAASGDAYSSLAVTDPGIPPCSGSAAAAQVQVYPPGETHAALIAAPSGMLVCTSPNTTAYRSSIIIPVSATQI